MAIFSLALVNRSWPFKRFGSTLTRRHRVTATALGAALLAGGVVLLPGSAAVASPTDPCAAPTNPVVCENSKPGTPSNQWDISNEGDTSIQGFATDMSVNVGSPISFKVMTNAPYTMDIYRLGYYQGDGARKQGSVSVQPRTQPACLTEPATGLVDCGNWAVSGTWSVPSTAVSGVYLALLTRTDTGGQSQIPFVVRDDSSRADVVFQTADPTWQAYNTYGGNSFYTGSPAGRAYKVSYNRPLLTRGWAGGRDALFSNEFPMIRFLERNGYDVSYVSGIDSDRNGQLLKNHKTFLSVGHDEYWSGAQRANVESARDAGVNLAFFAGNEVYWRTRYENSIDGSGTARRTLVCYKETWDNAKSDPSSQWTGTWRDGRFSPPATGGAAPENGLTGTLYMANHDDLTMEVTAAEGKQRFWRNTALSSLAAGTTAALAPHTVGYESNEDLDNGFRPAGAIRLSTTTGPTPEYLVGYGPVVTPGTTTHHMTLYKATSGALVFSAGTIQFAWGLDEVHDGTNEPADSRMQQSVVNLMADMSAQPLTLMSTLRASAKSTDTTAPTSVITSPAAGASQTNGTQVTVSGTATDAGGGVVAGVEVSTDGGSTWHPATTGTTSWSYTYIATGSGAVSLKSRATDDSANIETPSAGRSVTVNCPCSLFGNVTPGTPQVNDTNDTELGVRFTPQVNGAITGVRFYKGTNNTGTHVGTLWSAGGSVLARGNFSGESASGWQTMAFSSPVTVTAGTTYVASYRAPNGRYADAPLFFDNRDHVAAPLVAPRSNNGTTNGVFANGGQFPTSGFNLDNYYVDVSFTATGGPPDTSAPVISGVGSTSGSTSATVTWGTDESATSVVKYGTSSTALTSTATSGGLSTGQSVTLTGLSPTTRYYYQVTSADIAGNAASQPPTGNAPLSLDTVALGACPCTVFDAAAVPSKVDSGDASTIEVGMKFTASVAGYISGMRFYKAPGNTGTHTGTLWTATGGVLTTGIFENETGSGWQTLIFATPVALTPQTTYVVSYRAPNGHYSADAAYFSADVINGPLTAPAEGNGVFLYGSGFPTNTFNSGNYWVDPIFMTGTPPPDETAPVISAVTADVSSTTTKIKWNTNESSTSVVAYGTSPTALTSTASTAGVGTSHVVTLTGLTPSSNYYYRVTSVDAATNSSTSPATTAAAAGFTTTAITCPCTLFGSGDAPANPDSRDFAAVELGMRFTPTYNGTISGVRFFKSDLNTGTHTGTLWTSTGSVLATGTFTNETANGWQTLSFTSPIAVSAGTTYVVSYLAPNGHYSVDSAYFAAPVSNGPLTAPSGANGVYLYGGGFPNQTFNSNNYWVDPVFNLGNVSDTTPPVISSVAAAVGNPVTTVTWTTNEASTSVVQYGTSASDLSLSSGSLALVTSHTVQLSDLTPGVPYFYRVVSADGSGNQVTSPAVTSAPGTFTAPCPCRLFAANAVPVNPDVNNASPIELGVAFVPSVDGAVTGVRFHKAATNTGTHTGTLWSSTGAVLATGTFANETGSGWQVLTFASPVAVTAGTTYVASYFAPNGHYSADSGYFANPLVSGPLSAPAAGNGRFLEGAGFPTESFNATNYWVDVSFVPQAANRAPVSNAGAAQSVVTGAAVTLDGSGSSDADQDAITYRWTQTAGPAVTLSSATVAKPTFTAPASAGTLTFNLVVNDGTLDSSASTATVTVNLPPAPTVSGVSALGSGTAADIAWTTDLASSSVVQYGTSASSLTSSVTGPASVTAHAVSLPGLTAGTRYFYRVVSATAGGSTTSPATNLTAASFVMPGGLTNDLALAGTPTASSSVESTPWGVRKATDGVLTSDGTSSNGWSSSSSTGTNHTEWFQVDLGSATPVNQATIWPRTDGVNLGYGYPVNFTVGTSLDGSTWTTAATVTNAARPTTAQSVTFPSVSGRYVRITGTSLRSNPNDSANPYRMQFAELGVYGGAPVPGTPADITAPAVSSVAATGSGTTATVTWTTDESSSSVVQYGTSATSLTSTATGAGNVTAHSVSLTGLTTNTRYYYRVTSADAAGNSTTSPATGAAAAQYAPAVTPIAQTTTADFTGGTQSSTYVSPRSGGDVTLAPAGTQEFTGTTIPANWTSTSLATGSSVTFANDQATVSGRVLKSTSSFANTRELDAIATLKPVGGQWLGATNDDFSGSNDYWVAFRTTTAGALVAEVNNSFFGVTTSPALSTTLIGTSHRYEIDWTGSQTIFKVDGNTVATLSRGISSSMNLAVRDTTVDGNPAVLESIWVTPYASTGTYTSAVLDAGATVDWRTLTPVSTIATGTAITYQVRTGPNSTAGGTGWSAWTTVAAGGDMPGTQRYAQYRATLTTNSTRNTAPTLSSVTIVYAVV